MTAERKVPGTDSGVSSAPTIRKGQVWRHVDDLSTVVVRDFAEYTCGWMVRVVGATPDLIAEEEFRKLYKLLEADRGA